MARNRMIKPDFFVSEQVMSCKPVTRLLFIGLWCHADDAGVHPRSFMRLKASVFPLDPITIEGVSECIDELIEHGLLDEYVVDGQGYWRVTGWSKHQRIDRPTFKYPKPEAPMKQLSDCSSNNGRHLDERSSSSLKALGETSPSNHRAVGEDSVLKGKEEKGKEKELCKVETLPCADNASIGDQVREVFEFWKEVMGHPRARLDRNRKLVIEESLASGYTVSDLKQAIEGCSSTPFNMGENDRNQRYDALDLILRDADHIDKFIANAESPPGKTDEQCNAVVDWE